MDRTLHQKNPFIVPTTDGKHIEEHFGLASLGGGALSIARMVAPPGWEEPFQNPEFDEYTLMVSGRKRVEVDGQVIDLTAGESLLIRKGSRVRYANPFDRPAEYWSLCLPAFSIETVHREG
ncbi:MAG TPA: cupin domain-containing protein [Calditrichia bacterium]|nr:cupin domain-containing protein [Calditrichota bacterium]HQU72604.1 cupin domain-containing protein [Calditrichia bacterium]HQV34519.1 cupin domain-containing protein [Calditrichia bacterium]